MVRLAEGDEPESNILWAVDKRRGRFAHTTWEKPFALLGELLQVGEDRDDLPAGLCNILMRLRQRHSP